jgi:hypothetical protein
MVTSTIEITVYLEGGVIQDITGIPDNGKVTVVDWDTEGVEPDLLTELEAGAALVSTWLNEPKPTGQVIDLETLEKYLKSRDVLDCYVRLNHNLRSSKTIIKPDPEEDDIIVYNEIDDTEEEFASIELMAANHKSIREALANNAFYLYSYELVRLSKMG